MPYAATIHVSSGNHSKFITDNNPNTYWESGNPLPDAYLSQSWNNFFLNPNNFTINKDISETAFDGNTNTKAEFPEGNTTITFTKSEELKLLSIKAEVQDSLDIIIRTTQNKILVFHYTPAVNYQVRSFTLPLGIRARQVSMRSKRPFGVFALGALTHLPVEFVVFNFGQKRNIGWFTTRQLNEPATKIQIFSSNDGKQWQSVMPLNPKAIPLLQIPLSHPVQAQFLKIAYTLPVKDYVKARLWEFNVYGAHGPYGNPPPAKPSKRSYEQSFGINTIWGWGYNVYSDQLKPGTGPALFDNVAHQLRTYHRLDWDMKTPANPPDFKAMANGKGTPAEYWLNWDREYSNWLKYGFNIDVTLTFKQDNFPDSLWGKPISEAEEYGKRFGEHFFTRNHLVQSVEIGNEPWNYKPSVYREVLLGMSRGIQSVAKATVLPCAIQAWNPTDDNNNYIDKYLNQDNALYLNALNTHIYSYVFKENGTRVAVNPEDPRSEVWSMANLDRFRDINMPGKSIYVTEFGYDSKGGNEDCTHSECVSELNQAAYGVRMALILWRLGAEKMYWYYFANVQYTSFLHNRSGLCGSYASGFAPKQSFYAFEKLLKVLGPYHFEGVIVENHQVYAYLYENPATKEKIILAWRPTAQNTEKEEWIQIPITGKIVETGTIVGNQKVLFDHTANLFKIRLSGLPVYLKIKQ